MNNLQRDILETLTNAFIMGDNINEVIKNNLKNWGACKCGIFYQLKEQAKANALNVLRA